MLTVNAKMEAGRFQAAKTQDRQSWGIEGPRLGYER